MFVQHAWVFLVYIDSDVDVFMLQEHWLTPSNMYKFGDDCPGFISFGSSAMGSAIESGPLYGRP